MFDPKLRDKLLFEDSNFTFSRRYFWAYNTLGVVNEGIKAMIAAYFDTFTADFWAGRHRVLWPLENPGSAEAGEYLRLLANLREEINRAVDDLHKVFDRNERTRKDIANLREQLFSGSSVRESRRAVEQGDNIKILTSVSMIFLPLTFVTVSLTPPITQHTFTFFLLSLSFSFSSYQDKVYLGSSVGQAHTHTHTHTYIYI